MSISENEISKKRMFHTFGQTTKPLFTDVATCMMNVQIKGFDWATWFQFRWTWGYH